jgi:hypothetical protein
MDIEHFVVNVVEFCKVSTGSIEAIAVSLTKVVSHVKIIAILLTVLTIWAVLITIKVYS